MKSNLIWILSVIMILPPALYGVKTDRNAIKIKSTLDISTATNSDISNEPMQDENGENKMTNINITIGDYIFTAKLYDNETAREFAARLPMSLNMSELNGNEKYYYLTDKLPTASEQVESVKNGDLMLYGSDCLVLFYKSFSTSYGYTRLGYIEDATSLASALGNGNAEVKFAVSE